MRREGIYSSHLSNWRKQRTNREQAASVPPKRLIWPRAANP